ncbi:MAG: WYL domain-containing protein, partial [Pseudomonadota bacterium]
MALSHRQFSQLQRLHFVEQRLFWEGRINRGDLVDTFGISTVQASSDLNEYLREAPESMWYDKSSRVYRAADNFEPIGYQPAAEDYLQSLLRSQRAHEPTGSLGTHGWVPDIAVCDVPVRAMPVDTLRAVLQHIRARKAMCVRYQSVSARDARWRDIVPTALGSDGFRWHVRALCLEDNRYKDFVVARIIAWRDVAALTETDLPVDAHWQQWVSFHIAPHPDLSAGQRQAIELDYAMTDGRAEVRVRRALLWYTLRHMRLEGDPVSRPASEQHIVLANPRELAFDD